VRLLRHNQEQLVFHLGKREKHLLLEILKLYPRVPPAHQPLSKSAQMPDYQASQRLLDDALAEQRVENQKQLQALLAAPRLFQDTQTGSRLSLSPADLEWLLQILNDIRVGSWVRLGSPDEKLGGLNEKNAPDFWAMELAGAFQMQLLQALKT
jgi:hypothetical protein